MPQPVTIIGGGLAGTEAALQLADRGIAVRLVEMRPATPTPVHKTDGLAELVCSNSLKSMKPDSAAGMLKGELDVLGSRLYAFARACAVPAGGALAVDRTAFSQMASEAVEKHPLIEVQRREALALEDEAANSAAVILATGPLTSDALAQDLARYSGEEHLAFYDAAAPIVMADSLNADKLFRQSRYEDADNGQGDYLNAPFNKEEYDAFISELVNADRVIMRDFETKDLFQACQPIEEIARKGHDAPRYGTLKPVGLTDPRTGRRPWAAVQLRAEDTLGQSYNLVGFQTNLTFPEQRRVFRMIPGLEEAEFARYGVMHRNTFLDAPRLLDANLRFEAPSRELGTSVHVAGQLAGTEGYCEAIRAGVHAAIAVAAELAGTTAPALPEETAFGALMAYATNPLTTDYQPSHVNFGIMKPLEQSLRNKRERYAAYAARGAIALAGYAAQLADAGLALPSEH